MKLHTVKEPVSTDPIKLKVTATLIRAGFSPREICKQLRISPATYYRRLAEIRRADEIERGYGEGEV